jgi:subtilase family serine protease
MLSLFYWRAMDRKLHAGSLALLALLLCACSAVRAQTVNPQLQDRVALPDNHDKLTGVLMTAKFLGQQSPSTPVKVGFVLPLRNQDALNKLNHDLYDPSSPSYHQFLTPQQFASAFGPTADDYNAVIAYAQSAGFTIVHTSPTKDLLVVAGSTQTVENAFKVHLNRYLLANGHVAFCNDVAPTAPQYVADRITGIMGLNSLIARHHDMRVEKDLDKVMRPIGHGVHIGNGPVGGLAPNDIKNVYSLSNVASTGAKQSVAVYEIDGFKTSDVNTFADQYGLPAPNITTELIDNFDGNVESTAGETEAVLDIDMVLSLAPAANIYVYESDGLNGTATDYDAEYQQIADDNFAQVVSTSVGTAEMELSTTEIGAESQAFQQMRSQGQSMLAASGDSGAYDDAPEDPTKPTLSVDDPASQEDVTGVGGTTLSVTTSATDSLSWAGEVVWQGTLAGAEQGMSGGSGGGVSTITPEPDYQTSAQITTTSSSLATTTTGTAPTTAASAEGGGIEAVPHATTSTSSSSASTSTSTTTSTSSSGGSCPNAPATIPGVLSSFRQVPDVALNADPATGYDIYVQDTGGWGTIGGTSAAAPLWAGFTALVNQNRASLDISPIGFLNPVIYSIGPNATQYAATFNDIICGNNLYYVAGPGYDDTTGWGTFIGSALLDNLTGTGSTEGTISGVVTDNNGNAVSGAIVTLRVASTGVVVGQPTYTDTNGNYTVTAVVGATYLISADGPTTTSIPNYSGLNYSGQSTTAVIPESPGTLTVNFVLVPAPSYVKGLQMISAPYEYSGIADFSTLFGVSDDPPIVPPTGTDPALYYWNSPYQVYVNTPTSPADTIHLGYGYWVYFASSMYLHRQGTTALTGQPYVIPLLPGWNMIGDPFAGPVPISSLQVTSGSGNPVPISSATNVVSQNLYTYGPADTNYEETCATPNSASKGYSCTASDSLEPYAGYWIYAYSSASLVVSPPDAGSIPTPPPLFRSGN